MRIAPERIKHSLPVRAGQCCKLGVHCLRAVERRRGEACVSAVRRRVVRSENGRGNAYVTPAFGDDFKPRAAAFGARTALTAGKRTESEALRRATVGKGKARLFHPGFPAVQKGRRAQDFLRLAHSIRHRFPTIRRYDIQPVCNRHAQMFRDGSQTQAHAVQASDISCVAVRIPTARHADCERAGEIVSPQKEGGEQPRVVCLDRTRAVVSVVAVRVLYARAHCTPSAAFGAEGAHILCQRCESVIPHDAQPLFQKALQPLFREGHALHCGEETRR